MEDGRKEALTSQLRKAALGALAAANRLTEEGEYTAAHQAIALAEQYYQNYLTAVDEELATTSGERTHDDFPRVFNAVHELTEVNAYVPFMTLDGCRTYYERAISVTEGLPSEYEGRARSSFGEVLYSHRRFDEALEQLARARLLLWREHEPRQDSLAVLVCYRLARTHWQLGDLSQAIWVLTNSGLEPTVGTGPVGNPRTRHHVACYVLLARLYGRQGEGFRRNHWAEVARAQARAMKDCPKRERRDAALLYWCTRLPWAGFWFHELVSWRKNRRLEI